MRSLKKKIKKEEKKKKDIRYKVKSLDAGGESVFLESVKILWLLTAGHKKNHKKCSYNFIFIF